MCGKKEFIIIKLILVNKEEVPKNNNTSNDNSHDDDDNDKMNGCTGPARFKIKMFLSACVLIRK